MQAKNSHKATFMVDDIYHNVILYCDYIHQVRCSSYQKIETSLVMPSVMMMMTHPPVTASQPGGSADPRQKRYQSAQIVISLLRSYTLRKSNFISRRVVISLKLLIQLEVLLQVVASVSSIYMAIVDPILSITPTSSNDTINDADWFQLPLSLLLTDLLERLPGDICWEIRQLIGQPLTDSTIHAAVRRWCDVDTQQKAFQQFGSIEYWDVRLVTNMDRLFFGMTSFNEDISRWNVSQVVTMMGMFGGARSFNQPLDSWNVSRVEIMGNMFNGAKSFNQPLSHWNVARVVDMRSMFKNTSFNQSLLHWDVSHVTNMSGLFAGATSFNQPLDNWNVSQVENMSTMFLCAVRFNQPLDNWNVSKVTNMSRMFYAAESFNQPMGSWNVSKVTKMSEMFDSASSFNQTLDGWNVS